MKTLVNVYAFFMGCLMVYGKAIVNALDKLGETFAPALLTIGQRKPFKKEGTK